MRGFWDFLRIPGVARLLLASTFPRLAYSMISLAVFFDIAEATGSVATAGLAVGVTVGVGSLTAGPRGHLVDRLGQTWPLYVLVPAYAISTLLLATFATGTLSAIIFSALVGLTAPPINMSVRPLWQDIVGPERVRKAYSIDVAWANLLQLLGPVVATLLAFNVSPRAGLVAVSVLMLVGGLMLALNRHSRQWVPEERVPGEVGLLRSPALRLLALEGVVMGLSAGLVTVGLPALATLSGQPQMAGWLMAAIGVGSIAGSIWAGARAAHIAPARGLRASTALFALCMLPMAFLPVGPLLMAQIVIAWTMLGPSNIFYMETIDIVRPRGTAVSALGTLWMIEGSAAALGNAFGGVIAEWGGAHLTLGLASLLALGSPAILSIGLRGSLKPATVLPA